MWTLLRWEGELRNSRLRDLFGIQTVAASRLISEFDKAHPRSIVRDPVLKVWRLLDEKAALKLGGSLEEYQALAPSAAGPGLPVEDARIDFSPPKPKLLAALAAAASARQGIRVLYRSFSSPEGRERVLFPTVIVRMSQRWHLRAWCAERRDYRDFNIGRIERWSPTRLDLPDDAGGDVLWDTQVTIRIGWHEALKPELVDMIRQEYFGGTAGRRVQVRAPLVAYVLQQARIATDPASQRPPDYLLQVSNLAEVSRHLFRRDNS